MPDAKAKDTKTAARVTDLGHNWGLPELAEIIALGSTLVLVARSELEAEAWGAMRNDLRHSLPAITDLRITFAHEKAALDVAASEAARKVVRGRKKSAPAAPAGVESSSGEIAVPFEQLQLLLFPSSVAASPNAFSKIGLFLLPPNRKKRTRHDGTEMAGINGFGLKFSGTQLCTYDEDIWLTCIRLMGQQGIGIGNPFHVNGYAFLKDLGKSPKSGGSYKAISESLLRLSKAHLHINTPTHAYAGTLLDFGHEKETDRYVITLNKQIAPLFKSRAYQEWGTRLDLKSHLSRFFFSFVCGHERGRPQYVKTAELKRLAGYEGDDKNWRRALKVAYAELVKRRILSDDPSFGVGVDATAFLCLSHKALKQREG